MSSKKKTKPAVEALDMQAPVEHSPESAMQGPLVMLSQEEASNRHRGPIYPDKVMADEYDKCGSSIPLLLRAILRELVVISRCTHEH